MNSYLTYDTLRVVRLLADESTGQHTALSVACRLDLKRPAIRATLLRLVDMGWATRREDHGKQFRVLFSLSTAGVDAAWQVLRGLGAEPMPRVFRGPPPPRNRLFGLIAHST